MQQSEPRIILDLPVTVQQSAFCMLAEKGRLKARSMKPGKLLGVVKRITLTCFIRLSNGDTGSKFGMIR